MFTVVDYSFQATLKTTDLLNVTLFLNTFKIQAIRKVRKEHLEKQLNVYNHQWWLLKHAKPQGKKKMAT